ncbi:MAG: 1,4-alpha-glucan branching enzyme, partial [Oscillospiraceae bacterium]
MAANKTQQCINHFHNGDFHNAYEFFGSHFARSGGKQGVMFRVWAPRARSVSVVGDFNGWDADANYMSRIPDSGVWELFIPGLKKFDTYKYA